MKHPCSYFVRVIVLTLTSSFFLLSCSYAKRAQQHFQDTCKNHAYTSTVLEDYLSRRFDSKSPVRIGIVPFSVPANLASIGSESPGLDYQMAVEIQQKLLGTGQIPIVEIFNRLDWPGKKDEFFTGNNGALAFARQANYDLVLVGYIPTADALNEMTAFAKVIEVESGITTYYGKSIVNPVDVTYQRSGDWWWFGKRQPSSFSFQNLVNDMSHCVVRGILSEDPVPL